MPDFKTYYKTVRELLRKDGYEELSSYCNKQCMTDYVVDHDNWDGGIDTYNIDIDVPVPLFKRWATNNLVEEYEKQISAAFEDATKGIDSIRIATVNIRPSADVEVVQKKVPLSQKLHFEVQKKQGLRADYLNSVKDPSQYPCFILVFNHDWNDYDYETWFCLFYFKSKDERYKIGELKLMCTDHASTYEVLPSEFDEPLGDAFCSLGITSDYYISLNLVLKDESLIKEVQHYLCDCTFDPTIYERHRSEGIFKSSLMRDLSANDAFLEGQSLAMGIKPDDMYSFEYVYHPEQNTELFADWKVRIKYQPKRFMRTIGIIGNNGVGKTQLLSKFVKDLLQNNKSNFKSLPHFKSVLVVCSTPFDSYPEESSNDTGVKYKRCCLEQDKINTIEILKENIVEIAKRPTVDTRTMMELWRKLADCYVSGQFVENVTKVEKLRDDRISIDILWDKLEENVGILSSGQLHILSLVTYICAHIHYRSLLIIDEPEVHLHPHITMEFVSMLSDLLTVFKSYALIATHTPLVVREMASANVFLMQKIQEGIPQIGPVAFETLGEDVTVLYRNLFGYDEKVSFFKKMVDKLCSEGKSYNNIIKFFEPDVKLSVNAMLIIRDAIETSDNAQI